MKRTDIRAGVVYAVKSSYGPPSPIVFLEDGAAGAVHALATRIVQLAFDPGGVLSHWPPSSAVVPSERGKMYIDLTTQNDRLSRSVCVRMTAVQEGQFWEE